MKHNSSLEVRSENRDNNNAIVDICLARMSEKVVVLITPLLFTLAAFKL